MASGHINSWQIDGGGGWKQWWILFSWAPESLDSDCSHEIKRHLLLGRKAILDSVLKSREITLLTKVHIVKAVVFSSSHVWM